MARIRIGTSGWRYDEWRGPFYPPDVSRARELEYAARCFDSIEINAPARASRDVFVYFDNDRKAYAPDDARRLMQRLELDR